MTIVGDRRIPESPAAAAGLLRVALLNPAFWPEVRRGAERVVRELADSLIARGHHVRLITSHPGFPTHSSEQGMDVLRLWRPPDGRLRRRLYDDYLTHVPFSYLALRAGRDDVATALSAFEAVAAARWAQRANRVALFSYMGIPTRKFLLGRRRRLEITVEACRRVDAVVALSRAAADSFWDVLGVDAHVIHPGVNIDWFTPGGSRAEVPTIFCNASLDLTYKRVDLLIQALPHVRRIHPDARLVLLRPRDAALAARVQRECQGVEFITPLEGTDDELLLRTYRRAWISALPSRGEAFGLVLAESLACGRPVVGTNSGGIPEVVNGSSVGCVFEGDERALATALLRALELANEPGIADACRARALELSRDRTAEHYERLYRELLANLGSRT